MNDDRSALISIRTTRNYSQMRRNLFSGGIPRAQTGEMKAIGPGGLSNKRNPFTGQLDAGKDDTFITGTRVKAW